MQFEQFVPSFLKRRKEDVVPVQKNERIVTIPSREDILQRLNGFLFREMGKETDLEFKKILESIKAEKAIQENFLLLILPIVGQQLDYRFIKGKIMHAVYGYFYENSKIKITDEQKHTIASFLTDSIIVDQKLAQETRAYQPM